MFKRWILQGFSPCEKSLEALASLTFSRMLETTCREDVFIGLNESRRIFQIFFLLFQTVSFSHSPLRHLQGVLGSITL